MKSVVSQSGLTAVILSAREIKVLQDAFTIFEGAAFHLRETVIEENLTNARDITKALIEISGVTSKEAAKPEQEAPPADGSGLGSTSG